MSCKHVYKYFRVPEVCGRILGVHHLRWNSVKNQLESDTSYLVIGRLTFCFFMAIYLCADAFYATILFGTGMEVVYLVEIPLIALLALKILRILPSVNKRHIGTINNLNVIDKMIFRYYKRNRTIKVATRCISFWNFLNVFIIPLYGVMLAIHFKFPFCRMYTVQFLTYVNIFTTLMTTYIMKTVFINRLSILNDFIRSDVKNDLRTRYCEMCGKVGFPRKKMICDKHKIM